MENLGARVRELRKATGLSQEELGKRVGVSNRVIWSWEVDRTQVPAQDIPALARALSVTISELYGVEPPTEDDYADSKRLLAARMVEGDFTEEEVESIREFMEFVRARRLTREREGQGV